MNPYINHEQIYLQLWRTQPEMFIESGRRWKENLLILWGKLCLKFLPSNNLVSCNDNRQETANKFKRIHNKLQNLSSYDKVFNWKLTRFCMAHHFYTTSVACHQWWLVSWQSCVIEWILTPCVSPWIALIAIYRTSWLVCKNSF